MPDIVEKASNASRESKQIEFKSAFDPSSNRDWCEIIKDIVAIANSGGGIIIFGISDEGSPSSESTECVSRIDLADIANKIGKYARWPDPQVEIVTIERHGSKFPAFHILPVNDLVVFEKPGTYEQIDGKQRTAFGQGTIYFRHGAKSETATSEDLRTFFNRRFNALRDSWIKQVKRVTKAPEGSKVLVAPAVGFNEGSGLRAVRVVKDDSATPVTLTRNTDVATGTFLHEEVSEEIFNEINNVVDANRILRKGQKRFFLGPQVYYRVYAERAAINLAEPEIEVLFLAGLCEFYAPHLFWANAMSVESIAKNLVSMYLAPKNPQIRLFIRAGLFLGPRFCEWLHKKWDQKWQRISQPPSFYFTFKEMAKQLQISDPRLIAAGLSMSTKFLVPGFTEVTCSDLLKDPASAKNHLSRACSAVFEGENEQRTVARGLDYLAYGLDFAKRGKLISEAVINEVGRRLPGDSTSTSIEE